MTVRSASAERDDLYRKTVEPLAEVIQRIASAEARGDSGAKARALGEFARYVGQVLAGCALMGARRALLLADAERSKRGASFSVAVSPLVPRVPFTEAIEDVLEREPRLAETWEKVSKLYNETHAFALAKSADVEITKRVQAKIRSAVEDGGDRGAVRRAIVDIGDFSEAYAETVFRTNAANAYTAGTFKQSQDEDVREVMPAFQFTSARDADVRPNHRAADGLIARTDDPIWDTFAPPLGYMCRCSMDLVSKYELERLGAWDKVNATPIRRLPSDFARARPDPGFNTGPIMRRMG